MKFRLLLLLLIGAQISWAQTKKTKNVVLISIDGYRWQELFNGADSAILVNKKFTKQDSLKLRQKFGASTAQERRANLMPFFWNVISKNGQIYGNRALNSFVNVRNEHWFSYPGRSETITGFADNSINSNEYPNNPNENILEFVNKQKGYEDKVLTIGGWVKLPNIVNSDRNGMPVLSPQNLMKGGNLTEAQKLANEIQEFAPFYFGKTIRWDYSTYATIKSYFLSNKPKLTFIDFVDHDAYAHAGQYDFYLDAATYIDKMIENLWNMMQNDPYYKDQTTFIIVPDHGRGEGVEWISHGKKAKGSDQTWMAIMGPDTPRGGEMKNSNPIYQDQIAQTIANLLGFTFTANHPVAEPIKSVFK